MSSLSIFLSIGSGRHAFLGFGFRQREESSNFTAILDDHLQYLKRKKQAEEMRNTYTTRAQSDETSGEGEDSKTPGIDMGFKAGQTIKIKLNTNSTSPGPDAGDGSSGKGKLGLSSKFKKVSLVGEGLLPPPSAGLKAMTLTPPPTSSAVSKTDPSNGVSAPQQSFASFDGDSSKGSTENEDDDFGDFQS